jgi:hypothetical protein
MIGFENLTPKKVAAFMLHFGQAEVSHEMGFPGKSPEQERLILERHFAQPIDPEDAIEGAA